MENKITTFRELLLDLIPSKEIKQRISNKQIKLNNEPIKGMDIELDFDVTEYVDLGTFLTMDIVEMESIMFLKSLKIDFKDFFGPREEFPETNGGEPSSLSILHDFVLLTISKNEHFVFKKLNSL